MLGWEGDGQCLPRSSSQSQKGFAHPTQTPSALLRSKEDFSKARVLPPEAQGTSDSWVSCLSPSRSLSLGRGRAHYNPQSSPASGGGPCPSRKNRTRQPEPRAEPGWARRGGARRGEAGPRGGGWQAARRVSRAESAGSGGRSVRRVSGWSCGTSPGHG